MCASGDLPMDFYFMINYHALLDEIILMYKILYLVKYYHIKSVDNLSHSTCSSELANKFQCGLMRDIFGNAIQIKKQ